MTKEVYKPVKGYEKFYEVSNLGNVKSLRRNCLMAQIPNSMGYLRVCLTDGTNKRRAFVHRLVAEAFLDKPCGKNVVNHIDFNFLNNSAENLEWVTQKENMEHSSRHGRMKHSDDWKNGIRNGLIAVMGKPVIAVDIVTGETTMFDSVNGTAKFGYCPSCVSLCCNGHSTQHRGHFWRFAEC